MRLPDPIWYHSGLGVLRSVSEMTLVSRKIEARSWLDFPVFANDGLQIEIAAIVVRKARVESGCRLAPCLANFISFERAFYDIGDGSMFPARQAARQVASLRAAR